MTKLRLGLVQTAPVQGDIEATLRLMEDYILKAGKNGEKVDLLIFPELFITGYLPELWEKQPTPSEEAAWHERLLHLAREEDLWMVYGHPSYHVNSANDGAPDRKKDEHQKKALYNAATLLSPNGIVGTYGKVHLYGKEPETFKAGECFPVWKTPWGKLALQICYDIEFPEGARIGALAGANLLICPTANMMPFGEYHRTYTMARALENGIFVAYNNRIGPERDIDFCGGSCVATPDCRWLIEGSSAPGLYACHVNLDERKTIDPSLDYFVFRRPELYRLISESSIS